MKNYLLISIPIIVLFIISFIKKNEGELTYRGLALDTHFIGIVYMYPLPIFVPDYSDLLFYVFFICTLLLALNIQYYIKSKGKHTENKIKYEIRGFSIGFTIFIIGFVLNILIEILNISKF